jgi:hypothetical protein
MLPNVKSILGNDLEGKMWLGFCRRDATVSIERDRGEGEKGNVKGDKSASNGVER